MADTGHLDGILKLAQSGAWGQHLQTVVEEHVGQALDSLEIDGDEARSLLGEGWMAIVTGCAFEDMATRGLGPGGQTIVEAYLAGEGAGETASVKGYLTALGGSVMSLWEVSGVEPGKSFLARDMIRGGDPVRVTAPEPSRNLSEGDHIAARVIGYEGRHIMANGVLPFSPQASEMLLEALGLAGGRARAAPTAAMLRGAAPAFTNLWLLDTVPAAMEAALADVALHKVSFPLAAKATPKAIAAALATLPAVQQDGPRMWNWVAADDAEEVPGGLLAATEDGQPLLGNVEIKGRKLVLSVLSAGAASAGVQMLQAALGGLVGQPVTTVETLDD